GLADHRAGHQSLPGAGGPLAHLSDEQGSGAYPPVLRNRVLEDRRAAGARTVGGLRHRGGPLGLQYVHLPEARGAEAMARRHHRDRSGRDVDHRRAGSHGDSARRRTGADRHPARDVRRRRPRRCAPQVRHRGAHEDRLGDAEGHRGPQAPAAPRPPGVRVARDHGRAAHRARSLGARRPARRLLRDGNRVAQGPERCARGGRRVLERGGSRRGASMSDARKAFAIYAITRHGIGIATRLLTGLPGADLYVSEKLFATAPPGARKLPLPMGPLLADTFAAYECHVFVISIGAVVRMVAPLLVNKKVDPAVLCVDDAARFSICVLSGHVGRGNQYTERTAAILGAIAVVTTASDALGTLTVDILGRDLGWVLDDMDRNVTRGCAAVVNAAPVLFVQETGEPSWWPGDRPLPAGVRYATTLDGVDPKAWEILLIASDRDLTKTHPAHFENAVVYRPKSLVVGLGCDRGATLEMVERGVDSMLATQGPSAKSVKELATIDTKADEPAMLALA